MSRSGILMLAAAATIFCSASSVVASAPFDGNWSVVIITDKGGCDRAYRYPVSIQNGVVHYGGDVVSFSGRVANSGAVSVVVSRGGQRASGSGRLSRSSGGGTWHGSSSTDRCSGRWQAERR